jgi:hypothetical protein
MWRNTTSATNRRTVLASVLPHQPSTQSVQLLQLSDGQERELALLLALMNSAVFDYLIRQRLNGIDVTSTVVRQVPVPHKKRWEACLSLHDFTLGDYVVNRVAALLAGDHRTDDFVRSIRSGLQTGAQERRLLRLEIDAAVALAYGLARAEIDQVLRDLVRDFSEADREQVIATWRTLSRSTQD